MAYAVGVRGRPNMPREFMSKQEMETEYKPLKEVREEIENILKKQKAATEAERRIKLLEEATGHEDDHS